MVWEDEMSQKTFLLITRTYPYYYAWKNNEKRATLHKRRFRVVARLVFNSALVEFENGQKECISRNAIRRVAK